MDFGRFEELRSAIRTLIDKYRALKFRNLRLEQENSELKDRLKHVENMMAEMDLKVIEELKAENERLRSERDAVKKRLQRLIAELEQVQFN